MRGALLSPFDIYGHATDAGIFSNLGDATLVAEQGIFQLIVTAGVYVSAICMLLASIMIMISSRNQGGKLAEAKGFWIKVFVLSVLFFGVCGIIDLVQGAGLDMQ